MTRKALIVANESYTSKPLKYPKIDADIISDILQYKGYLVHKKYDVTSTEFFDAIDSFSKSLDAVDDVIFYFAGHGIQVAEKNYLIPIETTIKENLSYESPCLNDIVDKLTKATTGAKIIIIDACRSNPDEIFMHNKLGRAAINLPTSRGGLAEFSPTHNTLIAFSTSPGHPALDGDASIGNSPYCKSLASNIVKYGSRVEEIFSCVREDVIRETNFKQIPWEHSSLTDVFSFDNLHIPQNIVETISVPFKTVLSICHSCDGSMALISGDSATFTLKSLQRPDSHDIKFSPEDGHIEAVKFSENYFFASTSSGHLGTWSLREVNQKSIKAHAENSYSIDVSKDEKYLISIGDRKIIKVWDIQNGLSRYRKLKSTIDNIYSVTSHPKNSNILCASGGYTRLEVWDIYASKILYKESTNNLIGYAIKFDPAGNLIAIACSQGVVEIRGVENFEILHTINLNKLIQNQISIVECKKDGQKVPYNNIVSLDFSNCGKFIVAGTSDPSIVFIDVKYGEIIKEIKLDSSIGPIYSVCINPINESLVVTGKYHNAYVFSYNDTYSTYFENDYFLKELFSNRKTKK